VSGGDSQELKELAAAYALGALDPGQAGAFEAFLATSPEAQREVAEYREVNALLALDAATGAAGPSADLKGRLLARIAKQKTASLPAEQKSPAAEPRLRTPWAAWVALAAGVVVIVGLSSNLRVLKQQVAGQDSTIASLQTALSERETRLAAREATLNAILDPAVRLTTLTSTAAQTPVVQIFLNPRKNSAIAHAFNLHPAKAGRVYQLWFIPKGGKPIPSVTFNSEESGHAMVQNITLPSGLGLAAAAITDEPEGGSPQPTTTPILVGAIGAS